LEGCGYAGCDLHAVASDNAPPQRGDCHLLRLGVGSTQAAESRRAPRSTRDSSRLP